MPQLQPRVHVHQDVNPPQNPKGLLQNADILMWEANIGGQPATLIYDGGAWRQASPEEITQYMPAPDAPVGAPGVGAPVPEPTPTPAPATAVGGMGAGTTRATQAGGSESAMREKARARKEKELQETTAVSDIQEASAEAGLMGGLSMPERAEATKLIQGGMSEADAVEAVKARRQAGAQAEALEQE